ncbi:MAG: FAD-dependent monooxygenase [Trueperaceae bacterium]
MDTPVLIVGAGPTGLTAAIELARRNIKVRIVDKVLERPASESRALGMHARTQELYARMGVLEPMLEEGSLLRQFNFYVNGKKLGAIGFDQLLSVYSHTLMLAQSRVEYHLLRHLETLGVEVERPKEVVSLQQEKDGVLVNLRDESGVETTITTSYVIAADGGRSTIRKLLGINFDGQKMQGEYVMDAEVEFKGDKLPEGEGFFSLGKRTMLVFGKLGKTGPLWRIAVSMQQDDPRMKRETPTLEGVQALIDEHPFNIKLHNPTWASGYFISARMVDKVQHGRIFLAGDAAHIHSPVGGQGMNTGIQDAVNLAWKLALVIFGKAPETLLSSYEQERLPIMKRLLETTSTMEHVLMTQNPLVAGLRNTAIASLTNIAALQAKLITRFTGYAVTYANSPISGEPHHALRGPKPGEAAPNAEGVKNGRGVTRDLFYHLEQDSRLQVLLFTQRAPQIETLEKQFLELSRQFGNLFQTHFVLPKDSHVTWEDVLVDSEGLLYSLYKVKSEALYVLRPDGFVAHHHPSTSVQNLRTYLEGVFASKALATP